jgi:hypothetical protein
MPAGSDQDMTLQICTATTWASRDLGCEMEKRGKDGVYNEPLPHRVELTLTMKRSWSSPMVQATLHTIRTTCFRVVLLRRLIGLPPIQVRRSLLRLRLQTRAALDAVGHRTLGAEGSQAA